MINACPSIPRPGSAVVTELSTLSEDAYPATWRWLDRVMSAIEQQEIAR